jgi:hypothetical protein
MGSRVWGYQLQPGARESVHGQRNNENGTPNKGHPRCNRLHNFFSYRPGKDRVPVEFLSSAPPFLPNIEPILNTVSHEAKYGSFRLGVTLPKLAPKHHTRGSHVEHDWRLYLFVWQLDI